MDPKNNDSQNRNNTPNNEKRPKSRLFMTLLFTLAITLVIFFIYSTIAGSRYKEVSFSDFLQAYESGQLAEQGHERGQDGSGKGRDKVV